MHRPRSADIFVTATTAVGVGLIALLAIGHAHAPIGNADAATVLCLTAAVIAGELVPIKVGRDRGEVAPSTTFAFALLILGGVAAGVLALALACFVSDAVHRKPARRSAFNVAQYVIALSAGGWIFTQLSSLEKPMAFSAGDVGAFVLAAGVFFALNTGLVAAAVALHTGTTLREQFASDLLFHSATEAILLGLAPVAVLVIQSAAALIPLLLLPLLAVHRAARHAAVNEQLALHDALTGLPNRVLLNDRAHQRLASAARNGEGVALMILDLDQFKQINDTLGHHTGDGVLRHVAERLRSNVRDSDTVARLGGDEFAIVLGSDASKAAAQHVAEHLCNVVAEPFAIADVPLVLSASVGIACYPDDGHDVTTIMQRADVAMYQAKAAGGGVALYVRDRDDSSVERLAMAGALRRALDDGGIEVHFQPQVEPGTGRLLGVEALARWHQPDRGWIPPSVFIPVAEQTGLVSALTLHVLETAIREAGSWRQRGISLAVAVNLSARALSDGDLPAELVAMCDRYGVRPEDVVLEITETVLATDPHLTMPTIDRLSALGATISVDDFGTGFSSLAYLRRLPVSELKIDRTFVTSMASDDEDAAIVRFAIDLAHRLGMRAVAEGVETEEVARALAEMGCDVAQGYFYSRPVPAADVDERWIAAHAPVGEEPAAA
jgi:diguanylate cyclase (GGDEF)-like protein